MTGLSRQLSRLFLAFLINTIVIWLWVSITIFCIVLLFTEYPCLPNILPFKRIHVFLLFFPKHKNRICGAILSWKMFTHCFTWDIQNARTPSHTYTYSVKQSRAKNLLLIFHIIKSKITSTSITILPLSLCWTAETQLIKHTHIHNNSLSYTRTHTYMHIGDRRKKSIE